MKRRILTATLALLAAAPGWGLGGASLDSLYQQLDAAIDSAHIFLRQKNERMEALKHELALAATDQQRFERARAVYREYIPFVNDSALAYQYQCLDLAQRLQRPDYYAETLVALADQLTESGFYNEARIHFGRIDTGALSDSMLNVYLMGLQHLYGEMGYYSHDSRLRQSFYEQAARYSDSLMARLDSTHTVFLQLRTIDLTNLSQPDEAHHYCDLWQQQCRPGSREWATMAFYRSVIFGNEKNTDQQRQWLARSALVDIRNAIMDQGALWSLAETMMNEGIDIDRAHHYIDFSWQCLSRFSTHMRSWLVAPVVTRINDEYRQQLQTANSRLLWTIGLVSLLAVGLLGLLWYVQKKRRQLGTARNELKSANDELQLAIARMNDSIRVKDEYLGKYLSMCSDYIDKLDNYRIRINRKLKANQLADVLRLTASEQLKDDEVKELFDNFDEVFLHLFPTFVDDFNALLRPEERITPQGKSRLNTDLRIFALIRLGIDESSKIAEFLRYSPNSIYAYRARIKNKAAGNRADFERKVKEIGITGA